MNNEQIKNTNEMNLVEQKQAAENLLQQAGTVPGMEDVAALITQKIAALQEKISQKEAERQSQEKLLEQAKAMGMEDVVALIESKMQETNDFVKKATTTPESTLKNIETTGGDIQKVEELVALVDEKIEVLQHEEKAKIEEVQQESKEVIVDDRIEYTQYPKQFRYFDLGDEVRINDPDNTDRDSNQNIFAYDPQTRQVLPNKEGWEYGRTNVSYFFNKSFNWKGDVWNTPFDQLRFKPAKLDGAGKIIQKGEISVA